MSTCPECCGGKDTPITWTFCSRCTEKRLRAEGVRAVVEVLREHDTKYYVSWLIDKSLTGGTEDDWPAAEQIIDELARRVEERFGS